MRQVLSDGACPVALCLVPSLDNCSKCGLCCWLGLIKNKVCHKQIMPDTNLGLYPSVDPIVGLWSRDGVLGQEIKPVPLTTAGSLYLITGDKCVLKGL